MSSCCNTSGGFPNADTAKQLSRNYKVIWSEISAIQQAILQATSGCGLDPDTGTCADNGGSFCVEVIGKTPMTWQSGISAITVDESGTGYEPVVAIVEFSEGVGATATVTTVAGVITDIVMDTLGSGYSSATVVTIDHPLGQGFVGTAVTLDGALLSVNIEFGGLFYSPLNPTIAFSDITGAEAQGIVNVDEASVTPIGAVTSVTLTSAGAGYSSGAIAEIVPALTSPGTGAVVSLTIDTNPFGTDPYMYYLALIDQLDDCVYKDQIAQVITHFQGLGYTIKATVNPNTNSTIMWTVCWC